MDWKSLIEKAKTITDKSKPMLEKAKTYGSSAIAFAGKQVEQTPIFIKTEEEYNIHTSEKRSICIAYSSIDSISEPIHIMMPIWTTKAWTDNAVLKYIEISTSPNIVSNLKIVGPLEMRVSYMGEEQYRFHNMEDIKKWWKERIYLKDDTATKGTSANTIIANNKGELDPLTEVEGDIPYTSRKKKTQNK